ncbi:MAG: phosphotransferase [Gordonia sp. (in: high G+C Gram-positive bacteria)]
MTDHRFDELTRWLTTVVGDDDVTVRPASADASARRYFRATRDGVSSIIMDAPDDAAGIERFGRIAGLMAAAGMHVPQVLAADPDQGFMMLSDLGSVTYLTALRDHDPEPLMRDAIDAIVRWQRATVPGTLPAYGTRRMTIGMGLFHDWYLSRHRGITLTPDQAATWSAASARIVAAAASQPRVNTHRDYMARNLMLTSPNPGVLDFQDAAEGPLPYDLLSLLKDAFISWRAEQVDRWCDYYHSAAVAADLPVGTAEQFRRAFDWVGLQRHLQVLGIFARLHHEAGKTHYLTDAPRFVNYLAEVIPRYPELADLRSLLTELGVLEVSRPCG